MIVDAFPLWCSIAGRLLRQFTELRQSCCHPQIVRTSDNMLGKDRLSMQDIMVRLTHKAYNEYDQAARAHVTARLLQEAVAVPHGHRLSEWDCEWCMSSPHALCLDAQICIAESLPSMQ